jgi:tol-pal system protein YbgF
MGRVQQQLTDVNTAIKAGAVQPAPEPPAPKTPLSTPGLQGTEPPAAAADADAGAAALSAGSPPVAATTLYDNAKRDLTSGKADLAMDEFRQYLKFYGKTEMAPNAQFYIGYIRMAQDKFDMAIIDFDRVLEKYPTNSKTAEAHYYKGKALFQLGQRTKAAKEFQAVLDEFPTTEVAQSAKTQLRALGLSPTPSTAKRRR